MRDGSNYEYPLEYKGKKVPWKEKRSPDDQLKNTMNFLCSSRESCSGIVCSNCVVETTYSATVLMFKEHQAEIFNAIQNGEDEFKGYKIPRFRSSLEEFNMVVLGNIRGRLCDGCHDVNGQHISCYQCIAHNSSNDTLKELILEEMVR